MWVYSNKNGWGCLLLFVVVHHILNVIIQKTFGYPLEEVAKIHQWAISVDGGEAGARRLASQLRLTFKNQVGTLDVYLLEGQWPDANRTSPYWHVIKKREALTRSQRWTSDMSERLSQIRGVTFSEKQIPIKRVKRSFNVSSFDDPYLPRAWYMMSGARGGYDMDVRQVWEAGYSGRNVTVTILDDGIEKNHMDIAANYDPLASYDINDQDDDPTPRYDAEESNRHGTRCAGLVAATANNSVCTVGVAFNARIGGVRMLDGVITDAVEAGAISLNPQHIDIYSASWGPDDDGRTMEGPGKLAMRAFEQGIKEGRGGKGSIYIWASGNGGNMYDSCACDGYASSIYTLSVSSTSENGLKPWYLEECSSTLATTYSSGNPASERQVVTTSLMNRCTDRFTGTSASAPFAAGLVALALEANPKLTWRDVQHIVVETARSEPLLDGNWIPNGVGRNVSTRYGYGLMDGLAMVHLAERWVNVGEHKNCTAYSDTKRQNLSGLARLPLRAFVPTNKCNKHVIYVEHVQAVISLNFTRRGDLAIYLTSPAGTRSQLLPPRLLDDNAGEFKDWPFSSVHFWGETIWGNWTLEIVNTGSRGNRGFLTKWRLVLYGTAIAPEASTLRRRNINDEMAKLSTITTTESVVTVPVTNRTHETDTVWSVVTRRNNSLLATVPTTKNSAPSLQTGGDDGSESKMVTTSLWTNYHNSLPITSKTVATSEMSINEQTTKPLITTTETIEIPPTVPLPSTSFVETKTVEPPLPSKMPEQRSTEIPTTIGSFVTNETLEFQLLVSTDMPHLNTTIEPRETTPTFSASNFETITVEFQQFNFPSTSAIPEITVDVPSTVPLFETSLQTTSYVQNEPVETQLPFYTLILPTFPPLPLITSPAPEMTETIASTIQLSPSFTTSDDPTAIYTTLLPLATTRQETSGLLISVQNVTQNTTTEKVPESDHNSDNTPSNDVLITITTREPVITVSTSTNDSNGKLLIATSSNETSITRTSTTSGVVSTTAATAARFPTSYSSQAMQFFRFSAINYLFLFFKNTTTHL